MNVSFMQLQHCRIEYTNTFKVARLIYKHRKVFSYSVFVNHHTCELNEPILLFYFFFLVGFFFQPNYPEYVNWETRGKNRDAMKLSYSNGVLDRRKVQTKYHSESVNVSRITNADSCHVNNVGNSLDAHLSMHHWQTGRTYVCIFAPHDEDQCRGELI